MRLCDASCALSSSQDDAWLHDAGPRVRVNRDDAMAVLGPVDDDRHVARLPGQASRRRGKRPALRAVGRPRPPPRPPRRCAAPPRRSVPAGVRARPDYSRGQRPLRHARHGAQPPAVLKLPAIRRRDRRAVRAATVSGRAECMRPEDGAGIHLAGQLGSGGGVRPGAGVLEVGFGGLAGVPGPVPVPRACRRLHLGEGGERIRGEVGQRQRPPCSMALTARSWPSQVSRSSPACSRRYATSCWLCTLLPTAVMATS